MKIIFVVNGNGYFLLNGARGILIRKNDHYEPGNGEFLVEDMSLVTRYREERQIPLETRRSEARRQLKDNRDAALAGGFAFGGKRFQTRNVTDILNITNVGIAASADPAFQTAFRAEDNSWMPMDAATGRAFYAAMLGAGQTVWAIFGQKEALVLAAATQAELDLIDLAIPNQ